MRTVPRNNPIATVIRQYIDKKSGLVTISRTEIQRRFYGLDWKDQKKILAAFLESGQSDRQWAYSRLLDLWDASFEPKILELWEKYHERKCTWVVIRHFPIEFIKEHVDDFTEDRDYYFICRRLVADSSFVIDKDRLSKLDYLMALSRGDRKINDEEATDILFTIVREICLAPYASFELTRSYYPSRTEMMAACDFANVRIALYYLSKMGHDDVMYKFFEWQKGVQASVSQCEAYKAMSVEPYSDYEYKNVLAGIFQKHLYYALPAKYKTMTDEEYNKSLEPTDVPMNALGDSFLSFVASTINSDDLDSAVLSSEDLIPF